MRVAAWLVPAVFAVGCRDDGLLHTSGEHVEFGTDVVDQVCAGTIAKLDAEIERIETELALDSSAAISIQVLSAEQMAKRCESDESICVESSPRRLNLRADVYDGQSRYEIGRERVIRAIPEGTKPILLEGLATAVSSRSCAPKDDWQPASIGAVLGANYRESLGDEGRYLGGELLRWLLDTLGPDQVWALIDEVPRFASADRVRLTYMAELGRSLDTDLVSHWRSDELPIDPGQVGCLAPAAEFDTDVSQLVFEATLDCDSPRVHNDFEDPSRAYVEWTFDFDGESVISLGSSAYFLALPEGVAISVEPCACEHGPWSADYAPTDLQWVDGDGLVWLDPGRHRVRAYAAIGTAIDLRLQLDCDFAAQSCPSGQQCTVWGSCIDVVEEPAQLGEPCSPTWWQELAACDAGLACIGPEHGPGVCVQYCDDSGQFECPAELVCLAEVGCASACDPLSSVSTCAADWSCVPYFGGPEVLAGCVPGPANLGVLEPCDFFDFACEPGLSCRSLDVDDCAEGWFSGCCTPTCDPAAADPSCPPELPICVAEDGDALGSCGPA